MLRPVLVPVMLAFCLSGCATVTRGTVEQVKFVSEPEGAEITTTLAKGCTAPCEIEVPRKEEFTATATLPGHEPQSIYVNSEISTGGGWAMAGNVIVGGFVGMGTDVATGAAMNHKPNPVKFQLKPVAAAPAPKPPTKVRRKDVPQS